MTIIFNCTFMLRILLSNIKKCIGNCGHWFYEYSKTNSECYQSQG